MSDLRETGGKDEAAVASEPVKPRELSRSARGRLAVMAAALLGANVAVPFHAGNRVRRAFGWRPYGERKPEADFTPRDQARLDAAADKRRRKAEKRLSDSRTTSQEGR